MPNTIGSVKHTTPVARPAKEMLQSLVAEPEG